MTWDEMRWCDFLTVCLRGVDADFCQISLYSCFSILYTCHFLTAKCYASAVYAVVLWQCASVCVSACLSVTRRYCIETATLRMTQTVPHDSSGILVFWHQKLWRNLFQWGHPNGDAKMQVGEVKMDDFRQLTRYNSTSLSWHKRTARRVASHPVVVAKLFLVQR